MNALWPWLTVGLLLFLAGSIMDEAFNAPIGSWLFSMASIGCWWQAGRILWRIHNDPPQPGAPT